MVKEEYKDGLQNINIEKVTEFFKALTEPRRILILEELQKEEHCICDFVKILGLSQPAVSHHISLLSRVGLIKTRREGKKVICSLRDKKNINRLLQIAKKLIKS